MQRGRRNLRRSRSDGIARSANHDLGPACVGEDPTHPPPRTAPLPTRRRIGPVSLGTRRAFARSTNHSKEGSRGSWQWIIEGAHWETYPLRLARATTVVWLDLPMPVWWARAIRREFRLWSRRQTAEPWRPLTTGALFRRVFWWFAYYPLVERRQILRLTKQLASLQSIVRLRTRREVAAFRQSYVREAQGRLPRSRRSSARLDEPHTKQDERLSWCRKHPR